VGQALLVDYYQELPQPGAGDSNRKGWGTRMQSALETFKERVHGRYSEGTLQRLLDSPDVRARRAAVLALGLTATMESNACIALMLRDVDRMVRHLAADALWNLWFRAGNKAQNNELKQATRQSNVDKAIGRLDALVKKAPEFAEVYNQRAVLHFRKGDYARSVADCETALRLNPFHFGALAGMGQCYMKMKKPKSALKAFRRALEINPGLEGVEETIQFLEDALGEEGRKDDKK
jgi:tetratricopeptide (TPR) repeat protein